MKNMEKLFQKIDVLATPCTGNGTWKICEEDGECKCSLKKSSLISLKHDMAIFIVAILF